MTANTDDELDAATLEIVRNQLESVAEEMGSVLVHSAYSANIKERRDCSTALFDAEGRLIAQAEHIPVHLGALPASVRAAIEYGIDPGSVVISNDPYDGGGSHLPDLTLVGPLTDDEETIIGYGAVRAHHADIGGSTPGSMPTGTEEIYGEGVRIPPVTLRRDGDIDTGVLELLLANVRNPTERNADLRAQLGAIERAQDRIDELQSAYTTDRLLAGFDAVIEYSRARMTDAIDAMTDGSHTATGWLEGDGRTETEISITATVTIEGDSLTVDFEGTAPTVAGNVNAPPAVCYSGVYFVVRALCDPNIPPNHGCFAPVTVSIPTDSLLDPSAPAAVAGGNVETSQRITDVVFDAFAGLISGRVPAQSQGTMNNITIGARDDSFTYYETIGGGMGARPDSDGIDGVQVGMTNTRNTPIEALELEYPIHVERYGLRDDSGGAGEFRGGLGIERTLTLEESATVSLLTERRRRKPQGRAGGESGATGENLINGESIPAKTTRTLASGTTISILTPGGGGYGSPADRDPDAIATDLANEKRTD
ncbi:hydantoinase B/oxoprolinase family protein [Halocatena halophila]|uniref:hydantoinase B/oxoprolinase family protein n=1 Tax=Halocatena halophila TaxID=2814576 RepID=UPI002ED486B3